MHWEHSGGDVMLCNNLLATRNYFFRDLCCRAQKQHCEYIYEHVLLGLCSYPMYEAHVTWPTPVWIMKCSTPRCFPPLPCTQKQRFLCNGLCFFFFFWTSLDIKLANTYRNRVEGLCGDFDGRYRNDFTKSDGVWVKNVNAFGESWKVPLKRTSRVRYLFFYLIPMASTATGSKWIKP